jgi:hypothetical protein
VLGERVNTKGKKVYIVAATDDEIAKKESAEISKVVRNEGLRLIPNDIIATAMQIVHDTKSGTKTKQIDNNSTEKLISAFEKIGVDSADVIAWLGHPLASILPAELDELRDIYYSCKDEAATFEDFIQAKHSAQPLLDSPQTAMKK